MQCWLPGAPYIGRQVQRRDRFQKERSAVQSDLCGWGYLETFIGVEQRAGLGTNPYISRVVSKSVKGHTHLATMG